MRCVRKGKNLEGPILEAKVNFGISVVELERFVNGKAQYQNDSLYLVTDKETIHVQHNDVILKEVDGKFTVFAPGDFLDNYVPTYRPS